MLYAVLTLLCLVVLLPIAVLVSASFSSENALVQHGYSLLPQQFTTAAYGYILSNPRQILASYGVTVFVTMVGTPASLLITALLAYPLSRKDFFYNRQLSFYVFFTMLFNGGLVPWYIVVTQIFHLKDTLWVLIVLHLVTPWYVLLMRTFFSALPHEIVESAKIDGVGEYRLFLQIILPLSAPVLATVGLFSALMFWNDWWLGLLYIEDRDLIPLQYLLYTTVKNIEVLDSLPTSTGTAIPSESARMAMAVIAIGPIALLYAFFQKYFVRGLTVGAIKG
ncbi:carbohydrate ABC transporter permease [Paenibacillus thalictri]|uniref:Carbohydrate ABC transporter permease n=2 Tax=Paenibacillus thalictri TaxID=2527873 RepID=A0A4Q9DVM9_9BACL|nr:carbohydrate ABC transporter permease [Paenibacillus thalictri]